MEIKKLKQILKDNIKIPLIAAGGLIFSLSPFATKLLDAGGNVDFKYANNESKVRTTLNLPHLSLIGMNITKDGKTNHLALRTTFDKDFFGGVGYMTGRIDRKRNNDGNLKNSYHISPAFAKGSVYVEPLWMSFNDKFDLTEIDPFVQINTKLAGMDLQTAGCYVWVKGDEKDLNAIYAAINNSTIGLGLSKDYDDNFALQFGLKKGDFGIGGDASINFKTNNWAFSSNIAKNTSGSVGPKWPGLYCDYLVIGRPSEKMPYFTATGNKSKKGLAGKIKIKGLERNINSLRGEIGYNTGKNLAITIGQEYDFENGGSTTDMAATYNFNGIDFEGKINNDGDLAIYTNFKW